MKNYNPWSLLVVINLAVLSGIQYWRESTGFEDFSVLKGSGPNLVAVPILCFGIFMFIYHDKREPETIRNQQKLNRVFLWSLALSVIISVVWEFLQLSGNLVFDRRDLGFVGLGAVLSVFYFYFLRPWHFSTQ